MKLGLQAKTDVQWKAFERKYRAEMREPAARHDLELLAALSHQTHFAVGCYCADERRCHRSILRTLLLDCGATLADNPAAG